MPHLFGLDQSELDSGHASSGQSDFKNFETPFCGIRGEQVVPATSCPPAAVALRFRSWAPSASNQPPWRVLRTHNTFHFRPAKPDDRTEHVVSWIG